MVEKSAVGSFCLKKRIYNVAQFGLAVCFDARLGFWRDTGKVASPWISVTSFALLSYFY